MGNVMVIPARRQVGTSGAGQEEKPKLRVAAYCRVSTDSDEQATSYEAQVEHYTEYYPDFLFIPISHLKCRILKDTKVKSRDNNYFDSTIERVPLVRNGEPVRKTYCVFWRKDNSGYYIEDFAEMVKRIFVNFL